MKARISLIFSNVRTTINTHIHTQIKQGVNSPPPHTHTSNRELISHISSHHFSNRHTYCHSLSGPNKDKHQIHQQFHQETKAQLKSFKRRRLRVGFTETWWINWFLKFSRGKVWYKAKQKQESGLATQSPKLRYKTKAKKYGIVSCCQLDQSKFYYS